MDLWVFCLFIFKLILILGQANVVVELAVNCSCVTSWGGAHVGNG